MAQFSAIPLVKKIPLYQEENNSSPILEYKTIGEEFIVYVQEGAPTIFLKTFDRIGRIAFVESKNLELLVNDNREIEWLTFPIEEDE